MRKPVLVVACVLFLGAVCRAQTKPYNFVPKWKVGDKKTMKMQQIESEFKKGKWSEGDTVLLGSELQVQSEDANTYTMKVLYENIALKAAINLYEKLGEELRSYQNLTLKYSIDKKTGKADLLNWKEAKAFMDESFAQITNVIQKKSPEAAKYTGAILGPLKNLFTSKKNIESLMGDQLGYLLFPFNKSFVPGDTLTITTIGANPFNPSDSISQTTTAYISSVNDEKKTCDIFIKDSYDLTKFKAMMKNMMQQMSSGMGATDEQKSKAASEIENLNFDVENQGVIHFDYNSTWPTVVEKTVKIIAAEPGGEKTEKKIFVTMTFE